MILVQKDCSDFLANIYFITFLSQCNNWKKTKTKQRKKTKHKTFESWLAAFFMHLFKSANQILIHISNSVKHTQILSEMSNSAVQSKKIVLLII